MTEYEQQAVEKVLRVYERDFGRIVSDALAQLPKALEKEVLCQLQLAANVYKSEYKDSIDIMRTNYGTGDAVSYQGVPLDFADPAEDKVCVAVVPDFLSL